ncbi:inositol-3-phosphate synthase, partial [Streptomyces toyocaensis]
ADAAAKVPGLMHVQFGDYHVGDVEFVAAFDVPGLRAVGPLVPGAPGRRRMNRPPGVRRPSRGGTPAHARR